MGGHGGAPPSHRAARARAAAHRIDELGDEGRAIGGQEVLSQSMRPAQRSWRQPRLRAGLRERCGGSCRRHASDRAEERTRALDQLSVRQVGGPPYTAGFLRIDDLILAWLAA